MINHLVFIMDNASTGLDRLLSYMNYRFDGAWYYPIPEGEWDVWGSAGPETEYGTALRILAEKAYSDEQVAVWLSTLADHYNLKTIILKGEVNEYRRTIR